MATGLEALASLYAPKKREPAKPLPDDIHALAAEPEGDAPRPKAFAPDESAFESALRFLGRPGYAVRNLLTGNVEGAYRQGADFLGDLVDAGLPGDWIPEFSRRGENGGPNDYTEGSDLIGGMKPGLGKLAADIGIGLVTDPLTYLGVGLAGGAVKGAAGAAKAATAAKGAKALTFGVPFSDKLRVAIPGTESLLTGLGNTASKASQAADAIPGVPKLKEGIKELGHGVRSTFAAMKPTAKIAEDVAAAGAVGRGTGQAASVAGASLLNGVDPVTQRRAVEILRGVTSEGMQGPGKGYASLGISPSAPQIDLAEQMALIDQRLASMPWSATEKADVRAASEKIVGYTRKLWEQGLEQGVFSPAPGAMSSIATRGIQTAPADYFPGAYDIEDLTGLAREAGPGLPSPIKAKTWTSPEELAQGLSAAGGALDTDVGKVLGQYGQSMGRAAKAAQVGKATLGNKFVALSDEGSRAAMSEAIDGLRKAGDLDSAKTLEVAFKGLKPRKPIMSALAKVNSHFKRAATAGFIIPRINFTVRNVVANTMSALSNPESRAITGQAIKRAPGDILGSLAEGLRDIGITAIPESRYAAIAKAARQSDGTRAGMLANIADPRLRSAVEHGVLDSGFIDIEKLGAKLNRDPGIKNVLDWTSTIAQSAEQRMRFGMFDDLLTANPQMDPKEAARIVTDTLFDYDYSSEANRLFRDIVPFGQFSAKAIPQAATFLAERPSALAAIRPLYTQDSADRPLPGYLQRQPVVPLGDDEQGDPQYLAGLGLPFETLGQLPNPSDNMMDALAQTRQGILGQVTPPLKSLGAALFGVDPMFGTPFGSYDKAPEALQALGADEHGAAGRAYQMLASTGLIQPLASPIGYLSGMLDDRKSAGDKALGALTGVRIQSVDEDKALQQMLTEYLKRNPDVRSFEKLYSRSDDPEVQALLAEMEAVKRRMQERKNTAAIPSSP